MYDFYADAGHGWLKVKKAELKRLGIAEKISSCSYVRGDHAYLEEDCDAETFIIAKRNLGEDVKMRDHISDRSRIRGYNSYEKC